MVITQTPSNGSSQTALEQVEPVKDEPPIGAQLPRHIQDTTNEKALNQVVGAGTPTSPRDELCKNAHVYDVAHLSTELEVDVGHGLTNSEAATRLQKDGPNKIKDGERISVFQILLRQVSNSLTLVLLITMILSFSLDDYIEGSVILAVILLNIVVGFIQDWRAEQTILSLQALSSPECKVLRGGQIQVVKAETLVVGDVVVLAAGGIVPADLRLFDSVNLSTDEALLTGESLPISKYADKVLTRTDMPIGDRTNMVYSASMVTRGRGSGIVIATAMLTEVGKIAALLQDKKASATKQNPVVRAYKRSIEVMRHALGLVGSPLQVKLSKFALVLFGLAILLAIIVFSTAKWDVSDEVLIYGICVAVAVIPESLIAVLTLTIAVGTKAMARSNIIIRKLSSLEAVGGVSNICSDKTGTLTQGKMIVRRALIHGAETLSVQNSTNPFDPTSGTVEREDGETISDVASGTPLDRYLDVVSLCNLSTVQNLSRTMTGSSKPAGTVGQGGWSAVGEPTEIALQVFAMRFDHGKAQAMAKKNRTMVAEFPFDSSIKRMTMAYTRPADNVVDLFTKGATEAVLPISTCSEAEKARINADAEAMASQGLRVLCLAHRTTDSNDEKAFADRSIAEKDLTFVGLIGLYDPPRAETAGAVQTCQRAGITVHMLTGDHIRTAAAIAEEVGIVGHYSGQEAGEVMAASDFDKLSDDQIDQLEKLPLVVARCSPTTKVRMVQALHRRNAFCIMTGDGINDSPALKLADIGIAMGLNGSDVAKQAADMVLADDNFASIVRAIQEGRRLFDNIQKVSSPILTPFAQTDNVHSSCSIF
jgi:P-type Na+/K+ transporter